jgi:hypothetical protein
MQSFMHYAVADSRPLQPPPLPKQCPIGVLAGEGKPPIGPPEEVLLLLVHEGGNSPALLAALHLEVVEEPGSPAPLLGLRAFRPDAIPVALHAPIVGARGRPDNGRSSGSRNRTRL